MADIKIRIVAEINRSWGTVTLDLRQAHPLGGNVLGDELDLALGKSMRQIRDFYRASRRAVPRA